MTEEDYKNQTPKEILKALQVLFILLLAGMVLFAALVVIVDIVNGPLLEKETRSAGNILVSAVIIIAVACVFGARSYYNKTMTLDNLRSFSLTDKLNQYRAALIIYMAFCEGPALFSIIIFFLTGYYWVFIVTILLIAVMLLKAPTKARITSELKLDWQEQEKLG
jgi:hypothetical protein